jgi:hypothetical protein
MQVRLSSKLDSAKLRQRVTVYRRQSAIWYPELRIS